MFTTNARKTIVEAAGPLDKARRLTRPPRLTLHITRPCAVTRFRQSVSPARFFFQCKRRETYASQVLNFIVKMQCAKIQIRVSSTRWHQFYSNCCNCRTNKSATCISSDTSESESAQNHVKHRCLKLQFYNPPIILAVFV